MDHSLAQDLRTKYAHLLDHYGFQIIKESYDTENFGNEEICLQSKALVVRIVKDRGEVFLDLRKNGDETWISLQTLLNFLGDNSHSYTLEDTINSFADFYEQIEKLLLQPEDGTLRKEFSSFLRTRREALLWKVEIDK